MQWLNLGCPLPLLTSAAAVLSLQKNWGAVARMLLEYRLEGPVLPNVAQAAR